MEIIPLAGFSRIDAIDIFEDELKNLFGKDKYGFKNYQKFLYAQLNMIENRNEKPNRSECITYKNINLYSIRKPQKKNTRVLYYYMRNNRIILLSAFVENTHASYEHGKKQAYSRLKNLGII